MTHTSIHHRPVAILGIAAACVLALSATTASARTFYFNHAGTMVQQPLPTKWSCVLQRASTGKTQTMRCRAAPRAAHASSTRFGLNANGSAPAPPASALAPRQPAAPTPPTIVRAAAPNSGFDWGDAGFGAAAGFAISMIALGGGLAVSQSHSRLIRRRTA